MMRLNRIIDMVTHLILGVFICFSIYSHFISGTIFSINNYLALIFWVTSPLFIIYKKNYSFVLLELVFALFNIINFNSTVYKFGFALDVGVTKYEPISVNPIILILLIGYTIFNRKFLISLFNGMLFNSEKDRVEEREKLISFYRKKFDQWTDFELNNALSIIKEYPEEAQLVITEKQNERKKMVPLPPWILYPKIDPADMFWRMGKGEDSVVNHFRYYSTLNEEDKSIYDANYPQPDSWRL